MRGRRVSSNMPKNCTHKYMFDDIKIQENNKENNLSTLLYIDFVLIKSH